jgi:hypothetical protein
VNVHRQVATRKRHIAAHTLGLGNCGKVVLQKVSEQIKRKVDNQWCWLKLIWAEGDCVEAGDSQLAERSPRVVVSPRRWLRRYHRLSLNFELQP